MMFIKESEEGDFLFEIPFRDGNDMCWLKETVNACHYWSFLWKHTNSRTCLRSRETFNPVLEVKVNILQNARAEKSAQNSSFENSLGVKRTTKTTVQQKELFRNKNYWPKRTDGLVSSKKKDNIPDDFLSLHTNAFFVDSFSFVKVLHFALFFLQDCPSRLLVILDQRRVSQRLILLFLNLFLNLFSLWYKWCSFREELRESWVTNISLTKLFLWKPRCWLRKFSWLFSVWKLVSKRTVLLSTSFFRTRLEWKGSLLWLETRTLT